MKALSWSLALAALVIIPLLIGTWGKSSNAKKEETIMDFTPKNRAQVVIDDQGILVIGFCWQDRPFLVATHNTFAGGGGLQLLKVEGWCQ
jgi:hypothetical protein